MVNNQIKSNFCLFFPDFYDNNMFKVAFTIFLVDHYICSNDQYSLYE